MKSSSSLPTDHVGIADQWSVKPVNDACVGDLQTPVNSGWFTKWFINNLPFYRQGLSPQERGFEVGLAFGYLLYGPFAMTGPLRDTGFAVSAGLLGGVGAIHIMTALLVLYNAPGQSPNVQPADSTVAKPPADLFTRSGWSKFANGFWMGGCGGTVFAWLLCGTINFDRIMPLLRKTGSIIF